MKEKMLMQAFGVITTYMLYSNVSHDKIQYLEGGASLGKMNIGAEKLMDFGLCFGCGDIVGCKLENAVLMFYAWQYRGACTARRLSYNGKMDGKGRECEQ